jgi:hypothetical protein
MEGSRKRGRPRKWWTDVVKEDLNIMGIKNRQAMVRDRWEWRKIYCKVRSTASCTAWEEEKQGKEFEQLSGIWSSLKITDDFFCLQFKKMQTIFLGEQSSQTPTDFQNSAAKLSLRFMLLFCFSNFATTPSKPGPPHYRGFTITLRTTLGRTPLDEWSAQHRDRYLYNKQHSQERQISMPPAGFEPTIPASERPQTTDIGIMLLHQSYNRAYVCKLSSSLLIFQALFRRAETTRRHP